ncbi:hypothetical protein CPAV1605_322 [seawater metagenome]|uniref:START domain-containing protein n=1 Tax=seawater metagenome TaxID=1561972 RepID=A0A5E8CHR7_9ZZZZ
MSKKKIIGGLMILTTYKYIYYQPEIMSEKDIMIEKKIDINKVIKNIVKEDIKLTPSFSINTLEVKDKYEEILDEILLTRDTKYWKALNEISNTKSFFSDYFDNYITLKSISHINASFEKVFDFLADPSNILKYNKKIKNMEVYELKGDNSQFKLEYNIPFPFTNRELILDSKYYKSTDTAVIITTNSEKINERKSKKCVTMDVKFGAYFIKKIKKNSLILVNLSSFDFKGSLPSSAIIKKFSDNSYKLADYLQNLESLKE